jgi:hypothetical protein
MLSKRFHQVKKHREDVRIDALHAKEAIDGAKATTMLPPVRMWPLPILSSNRYDRRPDILNRRRHNLSRLLSLGLTNLHSEVVSSKPKCIVVFIDRIAKKHGCRVVST